MQNADVERECTKIRAISDLIVDAHAVEGSGGFSETQISGIAFILLDAADAIEDAAFTKDTDTDPE